MTARKMTDRQQVIRFCGIIGLTVNATGGVPALAKDHGNDKFFIETFDSWAAAKAFLVAHRDDGAAAPWNKPNYL